MTDFHPGELKGKRYVREPLFYGKDQNKPTIPLGLAKYV
jgi:hypothetical protein